MKFFIPRITKPNRIVKGLKKYVAKEFPKWELKDKKIYKIECKNKSYTVGEINDIDNEIILVIFEFLTGSNKPYYILCTKNRGFMEGPPILIGGQKIIKIEEFENDNSPE